MESLGFNPRLFYYVGITRGIDINKEQKDKINNDSFKFFKCSIKRD